MPSGEKDASAARGSGTAVSMPPVSGTVKSWETPAAWAWREERKTTLLPSGVQPTTTSSPGWKGSRWGVPPAVGTTKTSGLPSYSPVKATSAPSGEKAGLRSCPPVVNRRASPPSRLTTHRLAAYAKTTSVRESDGLRSRSGVSVAAGAVPAAARTRAGRTARRTRLHMGVVPFVSKPLDEQERGVVTEGAARRVVGDRPEEEVEGRGDRERPRFREERGEARSAQLVLG